MTPEEEFRENLKSVGLDETTFVRAVGVLTDDDYPEDKAVLLVVGAAKNGQDVIAAMEHIVELRKAIR